MSFTFDLSEENKQNLERLLQPNKECERPDTEQYPKDKKKITKVMKNNIPDLVDSEEYDVDKESLCKEVKLAVKENRHSYKQKYESIYDTDAVRSNCKKVNKKYPGACDKHSEKSEQLQELLEFVKSNPFVLEIEKNKKTRNSLELLISIDKEIDSTSTDQRPSVDSIREKIIESENNKLTKNVDINENLKRIQRLTAQINEIREIQAEYSNTENEIERLRQMPSSRDKKRLMTELLQKRSKLREAWVVNKYEAKLQDKIKKKQSEEKELQFVLSKEKDVESVIRNGSDDPYYVQNRPELVVLNQTVDNEEDLLNNPENLVLVKMLDTDKSLSNTYKRRSQDKKIKSMQLKKDIESLTSLKDSGFNKQIRKEIRSDINRIQQEIEQTDAEAQKLENKSEQLDKNILKIKETLRKKIKSKVSSEEPFEWPELEQQEQEPEEDYAFSRPASPRPASPRSPPKSPQPFPEQDHLFDTDSESEQPVADEYEEKAAESSMSIIGGKKVSVREMKIKPIKSMDLRMNVTYDRDIKNLVNCLRI